MGHDAAVDDGALQCGRDSDQALEASALDAQRPGGHAVHLAVAMVNRCNYTPGNGQWGSRARLDKAVANVNSISAPKLVGMDVRVQEPEGFGGQETGGGTATPCARGT